MKTMAIRLEDDLHAQLNVIATLEGETITDIIRASIIAYIESRKDALASKAEAALEEIERDAEARRQAIAALFGTSSNTCSTRCRSSYRNDGAGVSGNAVTLTT